MQSNPWTLRARLFVQRYWQPTSACLTCMPGNFANVISLPHWEIALRTGLLTGLLVVLLSFTRFVGVFRNRYGNAAVVGGFTAIGDALAHPDHYGNAHVEALVTGAISGLLALAASFLVEDRGRRLRIAWVRLRGR